MFDFGSTANQAHGILFGNIADMNAPIAYSAFLIAYVDNANPEGDLFSKRETGGDEDGWLWYVTVADGLMNVRHEESGGASTAASNTDLAAYNGQIVTLGVTWDGSNADFYLDGVADGTPALARTIDSTVGQVVIGNRDNAGALANSWAGKIGQTFWWDATLSADDMASVHRGFIRRLDALKFWCPCIVDPDADRWGGNAGTKNGTVAIALDTYPFWYWPFHTGKVTSGAPATTTEPTIGKTPVLELDLPGGTKYYASVGTTAQEAAQYKGKVMAWGSVARSISEHDNALTRPELTITLDDNDKEFAHIIESASGDQVRRSVARLKQLGSGLDPWTEFTGLLNAYPQSSQHVYELSLRQDDVPLEKKFPKTRITQFDWHDADDAAIGQYAPIIYGVHDSTGDSDGGMLPTYYVDTATYRYLVAAGWVNVTKVYVDGAETAPANYTITHPVVNGRMYTLMVAVGDPGTAVITVDVEGYDSAGNGTGEVITNPVRQKEHLLENFVYSDYETGVWATGNAPIDDDAFGKAANFCEREGYEGAIYIAGDQIKGRDFINTWLVSFDARAYWERTGDLAVLFLDHAETALYKDGNSWVRWDQHESGFSTRHNVEGITSRITIRYTKNSAEDQLKQTIEVRDLSIDEETADSLDQEYGPARVT